MNVLEKAKKHFQDVVENSKTYKVHVEEWGTDIYFKPIESLRANSVNVILQARKRGDIDGLIEILIERALDENGQKMFKTAEFDVLKREASSTVIAKIIERMNKEDANDIVPDDVAAK